MMRRFLFAAALLALLVPGSGSSGDHRQNERVVYEPLLVTEFPIVDCGEFAVFADFTQVETAIFQYDRTGALVRIIDMRSIAELLFYNSVDRAKSVKGIPGERENVKVDFVKGYVHSTGVPFMITVPGYGVIFAETGHAIWNLTTGALVFNSGMNQLANQDAAALCDFLK